MKCTPVHAVVLFQYECSWKSEVEFLEITEVEAEVLQRKIGIMIRSVTTATAAFTTIFTIPVL